MVKTLASEFGAHARRRVVGQYARLCTHIGRALRRSERPSRQVSYGQPAATRPVWGVRAGADASMRSSSTF